MPAIAACATSRLRSGSSSASRCAAFAAEIGAGACCASAIPTSTATGSATSTLPAIAASWLRSVAASRSTMRSVSRSRPPAWLIAAASVAAVIDGCLVAITKCSMWISAKPPA